jgi:hypothetical protein
MVTRTHSPSETRIIECYRQCYRCLESNIWLTIEERLARTGNFGMVSCQSASIPCQSGSKGISAASSTGVKWHSGAVKPVERASKLGLQCSCNKYVTRRRHGLRNSPDKDCRLLLTIFRMIARKRAPMPDHERQRETLRNSAIKELGDQGSPVQIRPSRPSIIRMVKPFLSTQQSR